MLPCNHAAVSFFAQGITSSHYLSGAFIALAQVAIDTITAIFLLHHNVIAPAVRVLAAAVNRAAQHRPNRLICQTHQIYAGVLARSIMHPRRWWCAI